MMSVYGYIDSDGYIDCNWKNTLSIKFSIALLFSRAEPEVEESNDIKPAAPRARINWMSKTADRRFVVGCQ